MSELASELEWKFRNELGGIKGASRLMSMVSFDDSNLEKLIELNLEQKQES